MLFLCRGIIPEGVLPMCQRAAFIMPEAMIVLAGLSM